MNRLLFSIRNYTTRMKYLNVAEKNDAAKTISGYLSNGGAQRVFKHLKKKVPKIKFKHISRAKDYLRTINFINLNHKYVGKIVIWL